MGSGRPAAAAPAVVGADPWPGPTIAHLLERLDRQAGSTLAIVFRRRRVTFSELREEASRLAAHLIRLGVGSGDRVAVLMPPSDAWAAVHYGVISSGALLVPINVAFKARELSFVLRQSGARCVVVAERFRDIDLARRIEEVIPEVAGAAAGEPLASAEYPGLEWAILHADRPRFGAWLSLEPLLRTDPGDAAARRLEIQRSELGPKSSCAIVYTSGSTGFPKPALLHHAGLLAGAWGYGGSVDLQDDDTVLVPWPTFHVSGMNAGMMMAHIRGRPAWLMEAYDPGYALDTIEHERISVFSGFDTTFTTRTTGIPPRAGSVHHARRSRRARRCTIGVPRFSESPHRLAPR
jgi:fatty-acyl-CoA synthase